MQLTRQSDYAIRAVLFLANSPYSSIQEIAKAQRIPRDFLGKIMQTLAKNGIVITHRGVGGGVSLARPPEKISVLDVVEAMEGPPIINRCLGGPTDCGRGCFCSVQDELMDVRELVQARLSRINFDDLARKEAHNLKHKRPLLTAS